MSNEQHFDLLIESSPDAVVVYDPQGTVIYVNPAFEETFGWSKEEVLHKRLDFVPEEAQAETAEFIQTVIKTGRLPAVNTKRLHKDGRIIDVQVTGALGRNDAGEAVSSIAILRDITEQRRSERERELLLQSEYEQRLLAETLTEVTIALTSPTALAAVLDEILIQAQRLVPYTTANIALLEDDALRVAGSRGYDTIGKEDFVVGLVQPLDVIPLSAQAIASRRPLLIHETQQHQQALQTEQTNWIRSYIGMPLALQDRVVGMLRVNSDQPNHFTDEDVLRLTPLAQAAAIAIENARLHEQAQDEISKRKEAEAALEKRVEERTAELQQSRQQASTLIQLNPHGIIQWDKDFHVAAWNPGATQIFGYTSEEAMGQHASFIIPEEVQPRIDDIWQMLQSQAGGTRNVNENIRQDGRRILCNWYNSPLVNADGTVTGVASFVEDITERKQAETSLAQRIKLSETLNQLSREASFTLELDPVLNQVCQSVAELFNATSAYISKYNMDAGTLTVVAEYLGEDASAEESVSDLGTTYDMANEFGIDPEWFDNPTQIHIFHVNDPNSPEEEREHLAKYGIQSTMSAQFHHQGQPIGILEIYDSRQHRHFTDEEAEFLVAIANQLAVNIDNANLYGQVTQELHERTQAEKALQESERALSTLMGSLPGMVYRARNDKDWTMEFISQGCTTLTGYTPEELLFNRELAFADLILAEEQEDLWDIVQEALAEQRAYEVTYRIKTKDGAIKSVWEKGEGIFDEKGQLLSLEGFITDITERIKAEETLHANELALRRQNQTLVDLAKSEAINNGNLAAAFREITEAATRTINVERASVWRYGEDKIVAEDLYVLSKDEHTEGIVLSAKDYPAYFNALRTERIIVAHDARTNPHTHEFTEGYLKPLGITSMLDASAQLGNETRAVLCLEHVGPTRQWTLEEQNFSNSLTDLLTLAMEAQERQRLEQEVQTSLARRSRELQLLTQMAQEIALAPNLTDLYQRLVTVVKEQFGYYHTQLLRYNPTLDIVELIAGYGEVGEKMLSMHHSMPLGVGLIGIAANTGKTVLSPTVTQDPYWQPNPLLARTKGELVVPIKIGERVLGVLDVQSDIVDALDINDQILLEGLCGQIAVAIESANLRQEMADHLRELSSLQQLMTHEGWQEYQVSENIAASGYMFSQAEVQPLATNGHGTHEFGNGRIQAQPLTVRGTTIGSIGIEDDPERPLNEADREFLNAISEQVAEALEIARLLDTTQEALSTQERLSTELRTVAEVSTVTSTIMERNRLLQSVVDLTKTSFNLYHAHLYLLNEAGETLSLTAGADQVGRLMTLEENHIPLRANSIVARAARMRESIVENDAQKSADFMPHPLLPRTRSELAVPMIVGERLVGVLDVQSDMVDRFAEQDILIMRTLASQVAVAVQNAEQFAEQVATADKLREVEKLKSEFLASMSHELRTPLNSIIGFADVLLEGLDGPLNDRMEQDVRLIRDSGDHLRNLIGDILDMSKIEAGKMDLRYEEIDIRQMAQDVIATATSLAQEKGLRLNLNLGQSIFNVHADRTRLRQILWNIMGNAIKFTTKGNVTLAVQTQENNLLVSIRDTGIGISPENIPIVFEQFRQIDGSLNRAAEGTGLGMPITKKLVELHGGEIWVESVVDEGSTFWFTIPRFPISLSDIEI